MMIDYAVACLSIVTIVLLAAIVVLARQLVRTNIVTNGMAVKAMEHALAINTAELEYMRLGQEQNRAELLLREAREKARIATAGGIQDMARPTPVPKDDDIQVQPYGG